MKRLVVDISQTISIPENTAGREGKKRKKKTIDRMKQNRAHFFRIFAVVDSTMSFYFFISL